MNVVIPTNLHKIYTLLQADEGEDEMVLPHDTAMGDGEFVDSDGEDYVFSEGDEDDNK